MTEAELKRAVRLVGPVQREYARRKIAAAPDGWIVTLREPTRTLEQNARMWCLLQDLSRQVGWKRARWRGDRIVEEGRYVLLSEHPDAARLSEEDFKDVISAALRKPRMLAGIDGGIVAVGLRTSRMTTKQMADLMELIEAFGVEHGVQWREPKR